MEAYRYVKKKIVFSCFIFMLFLMGGALAISYCYQRSIINKMEEKSPEMLRSIQVQLENVESEETVKNSLRSRVSGLKSQYGVDTVIVYDSDGQVAPSAESDRKILLEFGTPQPSRVVQVPSVEGTKATAYFQTLPLTIDSHLVGYVRFGLTISPQTSLVKAVKMNYVAAILLLFLAATAALCYYISRLLRPLPK